MSEPHDPEAREARERTLDLQQKAMLVADAVSLLTVSLSAHVGLSVALNGAVAGLNRAVRAMVLIAGPKSQSLAVLELGLSLLDDLRDVWKAEYDARKQEQDEAMRARGIDPKVKIN